jgi:chemotaxis protein CheZ
MAAQPQAISPEEDLEALFDSIAEKRLQETQQVAVPERGAENDPVGAQASAGENEEDVHQRLGQLTRLLHDTLGELGYDKTVTALVQGLPDARDRLNYIAQLTGQAAEKALNSVDKGQEIQAGIGAGAKALSGDWERVFAKQVSVEEFRDLAQRTRDFLDAVPARAGELGAVLTDIMMAQDFHDLTGQVIKKIVDLAKYTEKQLVEILLKTSPPETRLEMEHNLAGPVINPQARSDVVTSQQQVDDLLGKLGF